MDSLLKAIEIKESNAPLIPDYQIIEQIGDGGMAEVWLAQRHYSAQSCVIKVLLPQSAKDELNQSRFLREAKVSALLEHPNIARVYDAGRIESGPESGMYLAMEYIPGCDLLEMLQRSPNNKLPIGLCAAIVLKILEALSYAHGLLDPSGAPLGIVHRDIAPKNIMVTFNGEIKLIDFGLVRTNEDITQTAPGTLNGTVKYMSPEQIRGERLDLRSDLFSLATVLYEMATGQAPAKGAEIAKIIYAIAKAHPTPPTQLEPGLPSALDGVLLKALEKRPEDRYQTATLFKEALEHALKDTEIASLEEIQTTVRKKFPEEYEISVSRLCPDSDLEDTEPNVDPTGALATGTLGAAGRVPPSMRPVVTQADVSTATDTPSKPSLESPPKRGALKITLGLVLFAGLALLLFMNT